MKKYVTNNRGAEGGCNKLYNPGETYNETKQYSSSSYNTQLPTYYKTYTSAVNKPGPPVLKAKVIIGYHKFRILLGLGHGQPVLHFKHVFSLSFCNFYRRVSLRL